MSTESQTPSHTMFSAKQKRALWVDVAISYGYILIWITMSCLVILYNKWVLAFYPFPYPITLTMWHMLFCSTLASVAIRAGWIEPATMSKEMYMQCIIPIGALYAASLWMGNLAYLFLSVSFIQMLKASEPVAVFIIGCSLGLESFKVSRFFNMCAITLGVATASYGEVNFNVIGVLIQLGNVAAESTRLSLIQILLQRRGIKLNPLQALNLIAPCCFVFLSVPFCFLELPGLLHDRGLHFNPLIFISNAGAAFGLNIAVFMLVGNTSALTLNIAGVVKDWILIVLSYFMYRAPVTALNLEGYCIAFFGVCWYKYSKLKAMQAQAEDNQK